MINIQQSLESVKSEMRPWVYRLVHSCVQKALHDGDQVALDAFHYLCNPIVLNNQSDVQQFEKVQELLKSSEHIQEHLQAIHNAFSDVHGDVEGM